MSLDAALIDHHNEASLLQKRCVQILSSYINSACTAISYQRPRSSRSYRSDAQATSHSQFPSETFSDLDPEWIPVESIRASKVGRNLKSRCGSGHRCVQRGANEDPRSFLRGQQSLPRASPTPLWGARLHSLCIDVGDPMSGPKTGQSGLVICLNHRVNELGM